MARKRVPARLDHVAEAATDVFIAEGFARARVATIASRARVSSGTVYLYAASKEALFDLALRRGLEDPVLWEAPLPHPTPLRGAVAESLWRCLQNAAHFPRLWVAAESRSPPDVREEVEGILRELYAWLHRYARALKLVERCAAEWPEVAQVFYRRFWRGGIHRVADYLGRRMKERAIPTRRDPLAAARLVVEAAAWMAVHRRWAPEGGAITEPVAEATALNLLTGAIMGDGP